MLCYVSKSFVVILKLWNIVNNKDYGEFRTAIFYLKANLSQGWCGFFFFFFGLQRASMYQVVK